MARDDGGGGVGKWAIVSSNNRKSIMFKVGWRRKELVNQEQWYKHLEIGKNQTKEPKAEKIKSSFI